MAKIDKKLSSILVKRGYISAEQRDEYMSAVESAENGSLTAMIVEAGILTENDLIGVISAESNLPPINLSKVDFDPEAIALINQEMAEYYGVLPIAKFGSTITLAVTNPFDLVTLDDVKIVTQHDIIQVVCSESSIKQYIHKAYDTEQEEGEEEEVKFDLATDMNELLESTEIGEELRATEADDAVQADELSEKDSGVVKLVNQIILKAYKMGVSDIHIEPYPGRRVDIRYRIDGDMIKELELPSHYRNALVSRIKIMSGLDIAERRKPQDGKITFSKWGPLDIELRVATMPTIGGCEDVVMRILAASKPLPLDQIGMSERNHRAFTEIIQTPYGIILCVGPTGSGKTTTLHSALGFINKPERKIWTAEDPVEITQEGLRQVQVNRKAGLDFARVMRSFLRADPDVIMVGEMRDLETTSTGIEASLTGHLVLSTLHTNNAPETVTRLLDMGIDEFSFADALLGVLAQRLVRTLCKDCKQTVPLTQEMYDHLREEYHSDECWEQLNLPYSKEMEICEPREGGCEKCNHSGYRGRMGLHELLIKSDGIRDLIYKRAKADDIRQLSIAEGMRTLRQDGIEKLLQGHTTMERIDAVCAE